MVIAGCTVVCGTSVTAAVVCCTGAVAFAAAEVTDVDDLVICAAVTFVSAFTDVSAGEYESLLLTAVVGDVSPTMPDVAAAVVPARAAVLTCDAAVVVMYPVAAVDAVSPPVYLRGEYFPFPPSAMPETPITSSTAAAESAKVYYQIIVYVTDTLIKLHITQRNTPPSANILSAFSLRGKDM